MPVGRPQRARPSVIHEIPAIAMTTLASGMDYIDLQFLGRPQIIATVVLHHASGVALIDPGPSTTRQHLVGELEKSGITIRDVRQILLTHIHLDHAGVTGSLLQANPDIEVFVHDVGAPHVVDPSRLMASATRLYGQDMDRLWGEVLPVPSSQLRPLNGGERITVAGRDLDVAYTPGHASHHVSFFDPSTRIAFVGDTAGIRRGTVKYIMPPTPPPDIDLEAWQASVDKILAWDPDTLFLTHFGPFNGVRPHVQELFARLAEWSDIVRRLLADSTRDEAARQERFVEDVLRDIRRAIGDQDAENYIRAGRLDYSWQGLARYWRRKAERAGTPAGTAVK
jgi:glyoxylase-like metal-dependent hydrolase (beta-lactamase superfamily II)